jgi:hypothetical protein
MSEEIRRRLQDAQARLTPEQIIAALDLALTTWRAPDSLYRDKLARDHGVFSREVLETGTIEGLRDWTGEALRALRASEMREPCWAPRLTTVWLAGTIPTAAFHAMMIPLLAGSAVYAKAPSHDPTSPRLFAESLRAADPDLGAALVVGNDEELLETADAVVAHGSDETVAAIRARVPPSRVFVGHGHKLSVAAVGPDVPVEEAAAAVGLDIALYDGRGCLSPAYLLVSDDPRGRADAFAVALSKVLQSLASELPRGPLSADEEAMVREMRARAAVRNGVRLEMPPGSTCWTVIREPLGSTPRPGWLRSVPVIPLSDATELTHRCAALAPHLSCLGHAGWGAQRAEVTRAVREGGGSRTCPLGRMQYPPINWNQDGLSPLGSILRVIDEEGSAGRRA